MLLFFLDTLYVHTSILHYCKGGTTFSIYRNMCNRLQWCQECTYIFFTLSKKLTNCEPCGWNPAYHVFSDSFTFNTYIHIHVCIFYDTYMYIHVYILWRIKETAVRVTLFWFHSMQSCNSRFGNRPENELNSGSPLAESGFDFFLLLSCLFL